MQLFFEYCAEIIIKVIVFGNVGLLGDQMDL